MANWRQNRCVAGYAKPERDRGLTSGPTTEELAEIKALLVTDCAGSVVGVRCRRLGPLNLAGRWSDVEKQCVSGRGACSGNRVEKRAHDLDEALVGDVLGFCYS
jgi:hypothetical protein